MAVVALRNRGPLRPSWRGMNASSVQAQNLRGWMVPDAPNGLGFALSANANTKASSGVTVVDSAYGRGWQFSGTSSYVSFDGQFGFAIAVIPTFTIAMWVYVAALPTHGAFGGFGYASDGGFWGIGASDLDTDGSNLVGLDQGSAWKPTAVATTAGWHHQAWTFDQPGNLSNYYTDGVLVATSTAASSIVTTDWKWWLGNEGNTTIRNLPCIIVDARIYSGVLSNAVVRSMYDPMTRWDLYAQPLRRLWLDIGAASTVGNPWYTYRQMAS